jgi:hypothetical protein
MEFRVVPDGKGGHYHIGVVGDFEFVNPLSKIAEDYIAQSIQLHKTMMEAHLKSKGGPDIPEDILLKVVFKNALKDWDEQQEKFMSTKVQQPLWNLLDAETKKEQIKYLRGLSTTWTELHSFICQAGEKLGFTYSFYRADFQMKGLDKSKLPRLFRLRKDNKVETVGHTDLTHGQLKKVINDRKVILAKFIDKGDEWHCFFYTFKSITGQENYQGEQPHIHYISSKWGIPRAEVVAAFRSGTYKSTPVHIKINKRAQEVDEEE